MSCNNNNIKKNKRYLSATIKTRNKRKNYSPAKTPRSISKKYLSILTTAPNSNIETTLNSPLEKRHISSSFVCNYTPLSPKEKIDSFNEIKFKSNQRIKRYSLLLGKIKEEITEINTNMINRCKTQRYNNTIESNKENPDHGDSTLNSKLLDEQINEVHITESKPNKQLFFGNSSKSKQQRRYQTFRKRNQSVLYKRNKMNTIMDKANETAVSIIDNTNTLYSNSGSINQNVFCMCNLCTTTKYSNRNNINCIVF